MPAALGGPDGAFLKGMVKWINANGEGTEAILAEIDAAWPAP
jgi:hypothetical protein